MVVVVGECFAAVDLGASSGRVVVGWIEDGADGRRIRTEELHRFDNGQVRRHGHDCWLIDELFHEICAGLVRCREAGFTPVSVGIDSWGVDFALLDAEDRLVGDVVAYRDGRTSGMDEVAARLMDPAEVYARTGIQRNLINTNYQLLALARQEPGQLADAASFLMVPDYLGFLLTGRKLNEYTNASTTGLLNARARDWDCELLRAYGIPERIFRTPSAPGTRLGPLSQAMAGRLGFQTDVVLVASHDTASAYLGIPGPRDSRLARPSSRVQGDGQTGRPACGNDTVVLSSGTWSLFGAVINEPITSEAARAANFTNEGGYGGTYRFLKNIMGLWMIQSVRRELNGVAYVADREGAGHPRADLTHGLKPLESYGPGHFVTFPDLIAAAQGARDFPSRVDVDDDRFLSPASMIDEVRAACAETGQTVPATVGELMTCIYESLVADYARATESLRELTGRDFGAITIGGGGCHDAHLDQLTADACGLPVLAGPVEATCLGNLLVQMVAHGDFPTMAEARRCLAASVNIRRFEPA